MRPRKSVNVASIVGSPEEEESRPNLRLRIVGVVVLAPLRRPGPAALDAPGGRGQDLRRRRHPQPGAGGQRPGTAGRDRRPQRHGAGLQHPASRRSCSSRAEAAQNPSIVGMVAALVGQTPKQVQASVNNVQYSPYEPVPVATGVSTATVQFLQTHQSEYPGVSVETVAQRTYPQGGTTATQSSATWATSRRAIWPRTPTRATPRAARSGCRGSRPSTSPTSAGSPGRQALSVDAGGNVVGTLSTTAPQIGDTVVLNIDTGLQQAVAERPAAADPDRPQDARRGRRRVLPAAPNGAAIVMNPQNGQVLALASFPTYDLNEWVGGISQANFTALQTERCRERRRHRGPVHARLDLQAGHGDGGAPGRPHLARRTTTTTPGRFKIPGCPAPGVTNDTGCVLHDDPGDSGGTYNITGASDRVERLVLLQPGRAVLGGPAAATATTPIQNEADRLRRGDDHRHRPARRGAGPGRQLPDPGQAARRGAQGVPLRRLVVHRRQHRDGLRAGRDRADADRAGGGLLDLRQPAGTPLRAPGGLRGRRPRDGQGGQEADAHR